MIRPCEDNDFDAIFSIIYEAAQAYRGVIPADCWQEELGWCKPAPSQVQAGSKPGPSQVQARSKPHLHGKAVKVGRV